MHINTFTIGIPCAYEPYHDNPKENGHRLHGRGIKLQQASWTAERNLGKS